jgi:hypothetical protein
MTMERLAVLNTQLLLLEAHYKKAKQQLFTLEGLSVINEFLDSFITTPPENMAERMNLRLKWKPIKIAFEKKYGRKFSDMLRAELEHKYGECPRTGWTNIVLLKN